MIGSERGQALVEAVAALPMLLACSLALVDGGVLVRDRVATAQAATAAARATFRGDDATVAARGALPKSLRAGVSVHVDRHDGFVDVRTRTHLRVLPGAPTHDSQVNIGAEEAR